MLNVLITGAASGIGEAVKNIFLKNNCHVYGLDINACPKEDNLTTFTCDITSEESLNTIKNYLQENGVSLDLIINVAGIHMMASLVESNYEKMKKVIDINLCGTMLVNRTFHSLLKSHGRIVIVTSEVASLDPMPFNGIYNVSKTALDCYAQSLRQELNLISQKVITIRPGAVQTPLSKGSIDGTKALANDTVLYKEQSKRFLNLVSKFMGTPIEPEALAKLIYKVSIKKHPKIIYKKHRNIGLVLLNILPKSWQCKIIKMLLNR